MAKLSKDIMSSRSHIMLPPSPRIRSILEKYSRKDVLEKCEEAWSKVSSDEIAVWLSTESKIIQFISELKLNESVGTDQYYDFLINKTKSGKLHVNLDNYQFEETPKFLEETFKHKIVFQWSSKEIVEYLSVPKEQVKKGKFSPSRIFFNISETPFFRFNDEIDLKVREPISFTRPISEIWNSVVNKQLYRGCNFFVIDPTTLDLILKSSDILIYDTNWIKSLRGKKGQRLILLQIIYKYIEYGRTPNWPRSYWYDHLYQSTDEEIEWWIFKRDTISRNLSAISKVLNLKLKAHEDGSKENKTMWIEIAEDKNSIQAADYKLLKIENKFNATTSKPDSVITEDSTEVDNNYCNEQQKVKPNIDEKILFSEELLSKTVRKNLINKYSENFIEYKLPQFEEKCLGEAHTKKVWINKLKRYLDFGWKNYWKEENHWTKEDLICAVLEELKTNSSYDEELDKVEAIRMIEDYVRKYYLTEEVSEVVNFVNSKLEKFRLQRRNEMKVAEVYSKATDKRIDSVKRSYSIDDSDGRDWADDIYEDEHGNLYTKEEFQQLFPLES